jgi:carbonic anhydrase/acetyltransferase-like protein (isoleucine patch superfamily)
LPARAEAINKGAVATLSYQGLTPRIDALAYVHPSAQLLGDVEIGPEASVWPTAVMRGDNGRIVLGARSNFQDGAVAHATLDLSTTTVGQECTIGHRAVLHGCKVGNSCLVGIGATLLDGAELGEWCFVAAGSLITPNRKFPPKSFILGAPAKAVRECNAKDMEWIVHSWKVYQDLARTYRAGG